MCSNFPCDQWSILDLDVFLKHEWLSQVNYYRCCGISKYFTGISTQLQYWEQHLISVCPSFLGSDSFASIFCSCQRRHTNTNIISTRTMEGFPKEGCKVWPHSTTCHRVRIGQLLGAAACCYESIVMTFSQVFCWCPGAAVGGRGV